MVEPVDTATLKVAAHRACGFESRRGHHLTGLSGTWLPQHSGPGRTRTDDRRGVNALLYQLSYRSFSARPSAAVEVFHLRLPHNGCRKVPERPDEHG